MLLGTGHKSAQRTIGQVDHGIHGHEQIVGDKDIHQLSLAAEIGRTFAMMYYTDVAHVSAAAVGTIMLLSRFLDGASDLIMGLIVDRTKSRYGKARPWRAGETDQEKDCGDGAENAVYNAPCPAAASKEADQRESGGRDNRPWLLRIAIPFALATFLMFSVPDFSSKGKLVYILLAASPQA